MSILFLCFLSLAGEAEVKVPPGLKPFGLTAVGSECVNTSIVQADQACDFSAFLIARTDPRILSSWCEHIEGSL